MKVSKIALIGFRATGKSTLGRLIAEKLHWKFLDMDRELSNRFRMDIQTWVREHGWPSFRAEESRLLEEASHEHGLVLATGGGIVEAATNREILKSKFYAIWLQANPQTILARIGGDSTTEANRPPLTNLPLEEEVLEVLRRRLPLYEECARQQIDTEGLPPGDLADRISESLNIDGRCARCP